MKQYYGLKIVSVIYKSLAILTVIVCLGALGYITVQAVEIDPDYMGMEWWIPRALSIAIIGGIFSFTCFVLAQLLDLFQAMLGQLLKLGENAESISENQKQILTGLRVLINQNREPAKTDGKIPVQLEERKERLKSENPL